MGLSRYFITHPLLLTLFIAHFLSDFHWEQPLPDGRKPFSKQMMWTQFLRITIPLVVLSLIFPEMTITNACLVLSHIVISLVKRFLLDKSLPLSQEQGIFLISQCAHLLVIVCFYWWFLVQNGEEVILYQYGIDWEQLEYLLRVILFILLVTKPMNVIFKLFFSKYQVKELSHLLLEKTTPERVHTKQEEDTVVGAGALIGNLERIIMGLFLILGQYTAIGLVFTAKSIARYDRISKSQAFAEYYLIGSLFSIIAVVIIYFVLF